MLQAIYTAATALSAQQYNIDTIGNNIANINTSAFKSSRVDFSDALYEQMKKPVQSGDYLQQGNGATMFSVRNLTPGETLYTGSTLDLMLSGPGYFAAMSPQGEPLYTRDGSFHVSAAGGISYLSTAEGYPVLDSANKAIVLPGDPAALSVDSAGNLMMNTVRFATLKVASFANPSGLISVGANKFAASDTSGQAVAAPGTTVRQGCLEGSNVDLAAELTRLMRAQRAFAVLGSAIRTADEMESLANTVSA